MNTWSTTPELKMEASPAESFLSTPGDMYPSLFGDAKSFSLNPSDLASPPGSQEDPVELDALKSESAALRAAESTPAPEETSSPAAASEKKTKKRKSWGQVLPEPKTNLPPRKRAKTEDEKEQRRVERVLRNRRAAQSSRERKRQEVEALEQRNAALEQQLLHFQKLTQTMYQELQLRRREAGVVTSSEKPDGLTLTPELFRSQDAIASSATSVSATLADPANSLEEIFRSTNVPTTVNPASIRSSPAPEQQTETVASGEEAKTSADLTQHPAEMLCTDLQCQSAKVPQASSQMPASMMRSVQWQLSLMAACSATLLSMFQRPLFQIAMSLKVGYSIPPAPKILETIIWLVTQPSPNRRARSTSTSTSTSTTTNGSRAQPRTPQPTANSLPTASRPVSSLPTASRTLRLRLLRKILTCSPSLARPLSDATLAALRLVQSEEQRLVDGVNGGRVDGYDIAQTSTMDSRTSPAGLGGEEAGLWKNASPPSKWVLLTLLWAIQIEERAMNARADAKKTSTKRPHHNVVDQMSSLKHARSGLNHRKRFREESEAGNEQGSL
ncbi:hypothetical protein PspLS_10206 [Pyricularia sp. CBS 133598]|nr:hypothetical protein PspLS_10206 [Pyricularia sp. CBS 133598]